MNDLLADLAEATRANPHGAPCLACRIVSEASEDVRPALEEALSGTIGTEKLAQILSRHGYEIGRRAIMRHRREGHTS